MDKKIKQKILIVDDSEMNRAILSEMLGDEYEIIEAEDGGQAVAILQKHCLDISLVLLDIVMPVMDGYEVLAVMNKKRWIEDIPVIMISAENSSSHIERAYELGVTDFISRPFDASVVRRRVINTILLYAKQKRLIGMVTDQIYEKEKRSNLMITILSHIVEFRNGESGLHILHVQTFTDILLKKLTQMTDKYNLTPSDMTLISTASALHDIGKIVIPDEILNKPGRLTDEEFAVMKTHSSIGAAMLEEMPFYQNEPIVKVGREICRWHHERFDGRGYPDGLKGDEIPISAQIVALADVYDALTSDRVYKKAYSHEKAMDMILNGECGAFNPLLLQCLKDSAEEIKNELIENSGGHNAERDMKNITDEILRHDELSSTDRSIRLLEQEQLKNDFFKSVSTEIIFEYSIDPAMITFSDYGAQRLGVDKFVINPLDDKKVLSFINENDLQKFSARIHEAEPEKSVVRFHCPIIINGEKKQAEIICKVLWTYDEQQKYSGVIGKVVEE
jgi:putative two-component system response regulator